MDETPFKMILTQNKLPSISDHQVTLRNGRSVAFAPEEEEEDESPYGLVKLSDGGVIWGRNESKYIAHHKRNIAFINYKRSNDNDKSYTIEELKQYAKELELLITDSKKDLVSRILDDRDMYYQ